MVNNILNFKGYNSFKFIELGIHVLLFRIHEFELEKIDH